MILNEGRIGGRLPITGTLAAGSPPLIFRDLPLFLFESFKSFENANPANLMMMEWWEWYLRESGLLMEHLMFTQQRLSSPKIWSVGGGAGCNLVHFQHFLAYLIPFRKKKYLQPMGKNLPRRGIHGQVCKWGVPSYGRISQNSIWWLPLTPPDIHAECDNLHTWKKKKW